MKWTIFVLMISILSAMTVSAADHNTNVAKADPNIQFQIPASVFKPLVTEKYEYYQVSGKTETELRRQMTANGTKWDDGRSYDSLTTWNVHWNYDYDCSGGLCRPKAFATTVDITFRYPQWARSQDAPDPLVAKWNAYMKNLITHENGHRDMAVQAAAELARRAAELPPARGRAELDREVDSLVEAWNAKLSDDEKQYDATTIHGTTQGAVFP